MMARVDRGMDLLARLSILEGAAGVKPGKWAWRGPAGAREAQKYFPGLHPSWTARDNQGVFLAAVRSLERFVGDATKSTRIFGNTAEGMASDYMMGTQPVTGNRVKPVFYEVGLTIKGSDLEDLSNGKFLPKNAAGKVAWKFSQRAKDVVRTQKQRHQQQTRIDPFMVDDRPLPEVEEADINPLYRELRNPGSPKGDKIREILKQMVRKNTRAKASAEIFIAYLDYIKNVGVGPTEKHRGLPKGYLMDLSKITGKANQQIRVAIRDMEKWLVENAPKMGRLWDDLRKLVADVEVYGELGYGQRPSFFPGEKSASRCRFASELEMLADWMTQEESEREACGCPHDDEVTAEQTRTVDAGPLTLTMVRYPDAPRGGYRF